MKNYSIILGLLFILISFGCENDEKPTPNLTEGTYISSYLEKSDMRLFTRDGEVFNKEVINQYIENRANDSMKSHYDDTYIKIGTNLDSILKLEDPQFIEINFKSNDVVIIKIDGSIENRNLIKEGKYFLLESSEIENKYAPIHPGEQHLYPLEERNIGKLKQKYDSIGNYKHRYFLKENNGKLTMPQLLVNSYYAKKSLKTGEVESFEKSTHWNINNEFNPNSYKELRDNDTLLIQEQILIFEKQ